MSDGTNSAAYSYLANSPLVGQVIFAHSGTTQMTATKTCDYLNRLTGIVNGNGTIPAVDSRNYGYNKANQRTNAAEVDGSYWVYGYDNLGQVTSGVKYWSDGTPVAGQQFDYTFDTIGNRLQTLSGGDSAGANLRTNTCANNLLNQATNRTVPGFVDVMGLTLATNTVSVNGTNAYQKYQFFREQMGANNSSAAQWVSLNVTAPGQTTVNGHEFLAQTPENFTYDADGNLTQDGRWTYTWDAENRLVNVTSLSGGPAGSLFELAFAYDFKGRRIQKAVYAWSGSAYTNVYTNGFVYDGWNLVATLNAASGLQASFMWGLDLSGSTQGAGGVGGLLAENIVSNGVHFSAYDGNGNVVALVSATNGAATANYEYGPFGEVIRATGPAAKLNPFRFSTKYDDDESDLLYYGYRYYDPSTGRWLSKDPIGEPGFELAANRPEAHDDEVRAMRRAARNALGALGQHFPDTGDINNSGMPQGSLSYVFALNNPINIYDVVGLDCPACDSGMGTHSLPISSPCGLRCCAMHDQCYDVNHCSFTSWASTLIKLAQASAGIPVTFTPCENCNVIALTCMGFCAAGKPVAGPMYYCAKQHRYITIPGDFPTLAAAKCSCCN